MLLSDPRSEKSEQSFANGLIWHLLTHWPLGDLNQILDK